MLTLPFGSVTGPLTRYGLVAYRLVKHMHMHMATVRGLSVGMATVSAELGHLQRLECVNITGSVSMAPTAVLKVLLSLPHFHSVADAKGGALACRLKGTGSWPG
jgi:hypothetical protein